MKSWKVEKAPNRYIQISLKSYSSNPQLYIEFTLFKKNYLKVNFTAAQRNTIKLNELELFPFSTIINKEFNILNYPLNQTFPPM